MICLIMAPTVELTPVRTTIARTSSSGSAAFHTCHANARYVCHGSYSCLSCDRLSCLSSLSDCQEPFSNDPRLAFARLMQWWLFMLAAGILNTFRSGLRRQVRWAVTGSYRAMTQLQGSYRAMSHVGRPSAACLAGESRQSYECCSQLAMLGQRPASSQDDVQQRHRSS